ncbi:MFS transporter [Sphingosinicella microcystinivorans]|uniref:MFS transporter n=1 Tax=Sphingosinicella microcystinivorans TaxID=335406 RepID=UPI0022F3B32C|nr:MFS transporter [Sphingosinicella microcystinivorans]WBX85188.1 MFS transporter [Sphingosinicella microcystinivorans]
MIDAFRGDTRARSRTILPDDWGLTFACFAFSQAIGLITYWTLPLFAGALMTGLDLSATEVGLVGTIEFSGLFLSSLMLAPHIDRGFRRKAAVLSVVIVISVNAACGLLPLEMTSLTVLRFIAGLGSGIALTIGNASIANGRDPEKLSGHVMLLLVMFMVLLMPAIAYVSENYGYRGVFLGLAGAVLLASTTIPFVPQRPDAALTVEAEQSGSRKGPLWSLAGVMLMLVALLFGLRDTLPWLVTEQIGTEAGMSVQQIGGLLSVMYAVSALGPVLQIFLARRMSARRLLALSIAVAGGFLWMFTLADGNVARFSVGIVLWATIYFMAYAQLYAFAALVDRTGRLASALGGAFIAGVTIAPFIGGYVLDLGGYGVMGGVEIALTLLMVLFTYVSASGRAGIEKSRALTT